MKNILQFNHALLSNKKIRLIVFLGMIATLILISNHVFAADLLAGTDIDIKDTMKGTGKHWLYWLDGGTSLFLFATAKKPVVFFSVLGVAAFVNALMFLTGG